MKARILLPAILVFSLTAATGCLGTDDLVDDGDGGDGGTGGSGGTGGDGGTGGNPPTGDLTCLELNECIGGCADQACVDECVANATEQAVALLNAFFACIDENGCQDQACADANCGAEQAACVNGGGGGGDYNCAELDQCIGNCDQGDQGCVDACAADTDQQSADLWIAANECLDTAGCFDATTQQEFDSCLQENCLDQVQACVNDA